MTKYSFKVLLLGAPAVKKNSIFIETSAKTGENVENAFKNLALLMIKYISK